MMGICAFFLLGASANASSFDRLDKINFSSVSGTGTYYQLTIQGNTNSKVSGVHTALTDNYFPVERSQWRDNSTYFYGAASGQTIDQEFFTFDMGGLFEVKDIILSVDNNDKYYVDYSSNGSSWANLFTINEGDGNVTFGMDTFSTDSSDVPAFYESQIEFTSVTAQYLRIWADHTVSDQMFSIGEFQAFGEAVPGQPSPTPEPTTMILFGLGLLGLSGISRRRNQ